MTKIKNTNDNLKKKILLVDWKKYCLMCSEHAVCANQLVAPWDMSLASALWIIHSCEPRAISTLYIKLHII